MDSLHTQHGHFLLKNWNLPDVYCDIARDHHEEEVDENDALLLMVRLVNRACNIMGIGLKEDTTTILAATKEADLLGLSEISLAELEIKLEDSMAFAK